MTKRMILMLVVVVLVLGGIFGYKIFAGMMMKKYMTAMGVPAQTVSTIKATSQDWQPKLEAVGSLRAVNGADLSSEVAGIVEDIKFDSGSDVEAGAVLVQLRAEDDSAHLLSLQAALRLAEITYARDLKQIKVQAVSQATVDTDAANMTGLRAQVAEQQAVVDKKTVRAPFAGHLGIRAVDIGQYLSPGTMIVTLQQLDPIYIDFTLPEEALAQIKLGQQMTLTTDALAGKSFDGEISSINSKVDEATRNVSVRATLKNPDHLLLPGMFGRVEITTGEPQHYVTLPQTAITYNPYGNTVYLVQPAEGATGTKDAGDGKSGALIARQTFVTTGATRGDQVAVLSGVKEGDTVVTAGQIKLRNGAPITVNNDVTPADDANPKPKDQ
jgi:membrane fusion protein (multidrug efflux system)